MNELFQIPESKSPRLRWMERNHLSVKPSLLPIANLHKDNVFTAFHGMAAVGYGPTESDALTAAAKSLNIKLWNEE